MSNPRLRPRTYLLDPELARSTTVELPDDDAVTRVRSIGGLLRSLLPMSVEPEVTEGPVSISARPATPAD